jgi:D-arabinose 1-dehydrogenase-like Zn-dependent alcohol dehydrogenase
MSNSPSNSDAVVEHSSQALERKMNTYTAVEVSVPGQLRMVQRQVAEPGRGQVRIRVEACGICHTDTSTVNGPPRSSVRE